MEIKHSPLFKERHATGTELLYDYTEANHSVSMVSEGFTDLGT